MAGVGGGVSFQVILMAGFRRIKLRGGCDFRHHRIAPPARLTDFGFHPLGNPVLLFAVVKDG
jgi:hypothetical protein